MKGRLALFIVSAFILTLSTVGAETFEDFVRSEMAAFQEFKDERDREFMLFLEGKWEELESEKPDKLIEKPKIEDVPVADVPDEEPIVPEPDRAEPVVPEPVVTEPVSPEPEIAKPPVPAPYTPPTVTGPKAVYDFFGNKVQIPYDSSMGRGVGLSINEQSISAFWKNAATSDYEPLMESLKSYKDKLALNDWGFLLLAGRTAERIADDKQARTLLVWFMLTKAGYNTRVGYDDRNVYLMVPALNKLYSVSYITYKGTRFYTLSYDGFSNDVGPLKTYSGSYPDASGGMDFTLKRYPMLGANLRNKELKFSYGGKDYRITVPYSLYSVEYFRNHPQADMGIYAGAGLPEWAKNPLKSQLGHLIKDMDEKDAVNVILRFVQTSFKYATDQDQFGHEKVMFPEELMYYPESDCEDRSVLFSWLVRELLGLDVVMLDYPGHIATAVRFKNDAEGDYILAGGHRYTVCDPTYINANYGMTMPRFKDVKPEIIRF
ncbi:hypothetical protein [Limisalsivibrio acetivorans]|uniref:hypothetical protein n=1 Tax=Limisalsivibrio acetivorans TaxID=1304888 RepID=UPI0003B5ADA6|nr:hypothetical protein [Limisalsivibrio acetivorans]